MDELLTVKEMAQIFKVSTRGIYYWMDQGLPYLKIGGRVRFEKKKVMEWIAEQNPGYFCTPEGGNTENKDK